MMRVSRSRPLRIGAEQEALAVDRPIDDGRPALVFRSVISARVERRSGRDSARLRGSISFSALMTARDRSPSTSNLESASRGRGRRAFFIAGRELSSCG
jgi:hypothetical protein